MDKKKRALENALQRVSLNTTFDRAQSERMKDSDTRKKDDMSFLSMASGSTDPEE